ncbi:hypothetical protein BME18_06895 [Klebsiella michiganensis]|nr:hypothetical protein BME18_06895 [Klebsiella michiganensis]PLL92688.1 hypothetical protein CWN68_27955 [Klebsiella michiganensis]
MAFEVQAKTQSVLNSACAGSEGARPEAESRGKTASTRELTSVSDWGEWAQPAHLRLERRRV